MFIEKKLIEKLLWIIVLVFGLVSLYIAFSDLLTTALYFDGLFGATVFLQRLSFASLHKITGDMPQVSFEGVVAAIMVMVGQLFFAMRAKTSRKNSTEQRMYWLGYVFLAFGDTASDIYYRAAGGTITIPLIITSFFLYNIMSEMGITFATAYLWDGISGYFDTAKSNVKNLKPQNNNQNKHGRNNQNGQRQNQRQQPRFAQEQVIPTQTQRREKRQVPVSRNGKKSGSVDVDYAVSQL